jgi:hypothetical protein
MDMSSLVRRTALAAAIASAAGATQAETIEGVWWSTVTRVDCSTGAEQGSFTGMQIYDQGGTLIDTNSTSPASRGPGMGTWKRDGQNIAMRFRFMLFNPTGQWIGTAVVTRTMTPSPDGETAVASSTATAYNPAGDQIGGSCTRDVSVRVR